MLFNIIAVAAVATFPAKRFKNIKYQYFIVLIKPLVVTPGCVFPKLTHSCDPNSFSWPCTPDLQVRPSGPLTLILGCWWPFGKEFQLRSNNNARFRWNSAVHAVGVFKHWFVHPFKMTNAAAHLSKALTSVGLLHFQPRGHGTPQLRWWVHSPSNWFTVRANVSRRNTQKVLDHQRTVCCTPTGKTRSFRLFYVYIHIYL